MTPKKIHTTDRVTRAKRKAKHPRKKASVPVRRNPLDAETFRRVALESMRVGLWGQMMAQAMEAVFKAEREADVMEDNQMNLHLAKSEWKELVVELGNARRIYDSFAAQKPTGSEGREHYEQKADQIGRWERALLAQLALDGTT